MHLERSIHSGLYIFWASMPRELSLIIQDQHAGLLLSSTGTYLLSPVLYLIPNFCANLPFRFLIVRIGFFDFDHNPEIRHFQHVIRGLQFLF